MKQPIIVITGPTASGKTSLSLDMAKKFNGEIICADSTTVYRGMNIGTDKPSPVIPDPDRESIQKNSDSGQARMTICGIPHHMIDILNPDEEFNVAIFKDLAEKKIEEIHSRGNIPFLVGGSTMYIDALVYNYNIPHAKPNNELREELEKKSNEELFSRLIDLDPEAELTIDKNNKRRLIRALEVCIQTGQPFTAQKKKQDLPENVLYLTLYPDFAKKTAGTLSSVIPAKVGIQKKEIDSGPSFAEGFGMDKKARMTNEIGRQQLYNKINKRVDEMMAEGFLNEVKKLHKRYDLNTAMQATGYKQLVQYLEKEISLEKAVEKTKQSHRNYAKRQLTWLRKNKDIVWIKNKEEAEKKIKAFTKKSNLLKAK